LDPRGRFNGIRNRYFSQQEARFTRKEFETGINSSLSSLLSVRLREGYTVNSVRILDESKLMEVTFFEMSSANLFKCLSRVERIFLGRRPKHIVTVPNESYHF
jgi:hypothetical protein